nr:unnamed protein product [Callosobruchus analis]
MDLNTLELLKTNIGVVFKHRHFQKIDLGDERSGRPVEVITGDKVALVEELVLSDRRLKLKKIAEMTKLSDTAICRILGDHLGMQKIHVLVIYEENHN